MPFFTLFNVSDLLRTWNSLIFPNAYPTRESDEKVDFMILKKNNTIFPRWYCAKQAKFPAAGTGSPVTSCGRMVRDHVGRWQREEVVTWVIFRPAFQTSPFQEIPEILPKAQCSRFILSGVLTTFITERFFSGFTRYIKPLAKSQCVTEPGCCLNVPLQVVNVPGATWRPAFKSQPSHFFPRCCK